MSFSRTKGLIKEKEKLSVILHKYMQLNVNVATVTDWVFCCLLSNYAEHTFVSTLHVF